MIETIEDRRIKKFLKDNGGINNPDTQTWLYFPRTQQIIFIVKEIVNENFNLRKQIRELKGELIEPEEITEEKEAEDIDDTVREDIYDPIEDTDLGFMDKQEVKEDEDEDT